MHRDNFNGNVITLSSGAVVLHRNIGNDAQEAFLEDGREMTDSEWIEYCDIVAGSNE